MVTMEVWTCEMHPQILRTAPGTCPICGMQLIQKTMKVDTTRLNKTDTTAVKESK